jgi:hypothetical protein
MNIIRYSNNTYHDTGATKLDANTTVVQQLLDHLKLYLSVAPETTIFIQHTKDKMTADVRKIGLKQIYPSD